MKTIAKISTSRATSERSTRLFRPGSRAQNTAKPRKEPAPIAFSGTGTAILLDRDGKATRLDRVLSRMRLDTHDSDL